MDKVVNKQAKTHQLRQELELILPEMVTPHHQMDNRVKDRLLVVLLIKLMLPRIRQVLQFRIIAHKQVGRMTNSNQQHLLHRLALLFKTMGKPSNLSSRLMEAQIKQEIRTTAGPWNAS